MAELYVLGKYTPYGATQVPPRADGSNKYFLFASESGSKLDHEEEIYFCGKTVIWSSGQTVKKSFTLEHDIIQVVWTTFVPNTPRRDLCVLHTEGITIFDENGRVFSVVSPCEVERLWPLPTGLLLERLRPEKMPSSTSEALGSSQKGDPLSSIGTPSRYRIKDSDIPTFFSLLHPLEEVKPLATVEEDAPTVGTSQPESDLSQPKLFCSASSRIIFSSSDVPLIVLYDEESQQHSLCLLRRDSPDDAELSYDVAKQHHTAILSSISQAFPGVDEVEFIRDRAVRAALLEQEYLIRPDIFLEYLPVAVEKGVLSKNQKSDPAHHIFLCAGGSPSELGLCFLLPNSSMLECYFISQESLKARFAFAIPCSSAVPLNEPALVVSRPIAPGRSISLSSHLLILPPSDSSSQRPQEATVSIFFKDKKLMDFNLPKDILSKITSQMQADRRDSVASTDTEDAGGLVPMITPFKSLRNDQREFLAHSTPLRTPQDARYIEMAPDSPFYSPAVVGMNMSTQEISLDFGSPLPFRNQRRQSLRPVLDTSTRVVDNRVILELSMPVAGRFTIRGADGNLYRACISLNSSNALVSLCLKALRAILATDIFHELLSTIWSSPSLLVSWSSFSSFLMDCFTPSSTAPGTNSAEKPKEKGKQIINKTNNGSDFSRLMELGKKYNNSVAVKSLRKPKGELSPPDVAASSSRMTGKLFHHAAETLEAFHFVYEECSLNNFVSREQRFDLAQFLSLLHSKFGIWSYVDYYRSDFEITSPSRSEEVKYPVPPRHAQPPSIFSWLCQSLDTPNRLDAFPLPQSLFDCCNRIRKICRCIDALVSTNSDVDNRYARRNTTDSQANAEEFISREFDRSPKPASGASSTASLSGSTRLSKDSWQEKCHFLLLHVISQEFETLDELESFPWAVVQPIREVLQTCRRSPSLKWPQNVLKLIGREDLALQHERTQALLARRDTIEVTTQDSSSSDPANNISSIVSNGLKQLPPAATGPTPPGAAKQASRKIVRNPDGIDINHMFSHMRFSRDNRLEEVGHLLRSTKPMRVNISEEGLTERDLIPAQQAKLAQLCLRQLACSVGRGAFTLGADCDASDERAIVLTEKVHIPTISLSGKLAGSNAGISLEGPNQIPATGLAWGDFHNGVAAGLRVAPEYTERVTGDWIAYNRPKDTNTSQSAYAGFLLAMGLLGHLKNLAHPKVYEFLTTSNPLTSVAILLGLPAASFGSQSSQISRIISVHVPALHPATATNELDLPSLIQSSALLGLGLLHAGSCQRRMSEVLMGAFAPGPELISREAYVLSAGFGLGLVTLGQGSNAIGIADLKLADKLIRCMNGGKMTFVEPSIVIKAESRTWLSFNSPAGAAAHGQGLVSRTTGQSSGRGAAASAGGSAGRAARGNVAASMKDKPSLVLEGDEINTDITAPAAVVALGLMYLKTEDAFIASQLQLPDTTVMLDHVRPDIQLLRTCCKALVNWSQIEPSEAFIQAQMPLVVRSRLLVPGANGQPPSLANPTFLSGNMNVNSDAELEQLISLRQTYLHVSAGAGLAVAFKYAGSHHAPAANLVKKLLTSYMKLQKLSTVSRSGKIMLDLCINVTAIAWSIIMSGSGDLDALRHFRKLRKRVSAETTYGTHMAISMAIGFLFLGGGRFTFGTSNKAIAGLLMSTFPLFPGSSMDSRYHSQALRHMYVLAAESRSLSARDVDTLRPVYVPVDIYIKVPHAEAAQPQASHVKKSLAGVAAPSSPGSPGSWRRGSLGIVPAAPDSADHFTVSSPGVTKHRAMLPCLLPPLEWIVQVDVVPDRYWPVSLRPNRNKAHLEVLQRVEGATMLVKRRAGHLSYAQDPHHSRSLLTRATQQRLDFALPLASTADDAVDDRTHFRQNTDFLSAFSDDPTIWAFVKHLCHPREAGDLSSDSVSSVADALFSLNSLPSSKGEDSLAAFCRAALYECIAADKPEMIMAYLNIWRALLAAANGDLQFQANNFKFLASFYNMMLSKYSHKHNKQVREEQNMVNWSPLLSVDLISSASNRIRDLAVSQVRAFNLSRVSNPLAIANSEWVQLSAALRYLGIPIDTTLLSQVIDHTRKLQLGAIPNEVKSIVLTGSLSKLPAVQARKIGLSSLTQLANLISNIN